MIVISSRMRFFDFRDPQNWKWLLKWGRAPLTLSQKSSLNFLVIDHEGQGLMETHFIFLFVGKLLSTEKSFFLIFANKAIYKRKEAENILVSLKPSFIMNFKEIGEGF